MIKILSKTIFCGALLISALLSTISSQGQVMLKGGYTIASVNFQENYAQKFSSVNGAAFGIGYNKQIDSTSFSIQFEGLFIQKGAHEVYDTHGSARYRSETETKINYFEIPLLIKYTFGKKAVQLYLNTGFSMGIGLGGKYENETMTQDPYPNGPEISVSSSGNVKFGSDSESPSSGDLMVDNSIDFGLQLGGGLILFKGLVLDFRYGLGLTNLYDYDSEDPNSNPTSKNRVMQFTIGYQFAPVK